MTGEEYIQDGAMDSAARAKPRKKTWKRVILFCLLLLLFLAGIAGGLGAYVARGLQPTAATGEEIRVEIQSGMSSAAIAELLEEEGLIHSAFIFKYYLRYKGEGQRFQAGEYSMTPGMSLDEMIAKLNAGDTVKAEVHRFTVPEGWTVEQVADSLAANGIVDKERFLNLVQNPALFSDTRAGGIPPNEGLKHALEGYLFPETYELPKESSEQDIIERMLNLLEQRLALLPEDWEQRLDELGLTFHEMMTIASLIEREVVVDTERALVAGVIYNRIDKNMPLQIDATVQYALEQPKERLLYVDLEVESPYNTYKHSGLPPGPIASPGIESIRAALYPEETTYLFYVTKKDGTREHYFAETFAEHKRNIAESEKNQQKQ